MAADALTPLVGVFVDRSLAEQAVAELRDAGFKSEEIGMVTKDKTLPTRKELNLYEPDEKKPASEIISEDAAVGAATGAGIGALAGWGVITGAIPVVGPAIMAGTLGVIASNALGGAAIAGITGALTGWGIADDEARRYEEEVFGGKTLVTVQSPRKDDARAILSHHGIVTDQPQLVSQV